jgi:hypothetical protein
VSFNDTEFENGTDDYEPVIVNEDNPMLQALFPVRCSLAAYLAACYLYILAFSRDFIIRQQQVSPQAPSGMPL